MHGSIRLRQVRTGQRFDDRVEILSGLVAGETVAVDPVLAGMVAKQERSVSDG